jgi:hypothetical protein
MWPLALAASLAVCACAPAPQHAAAEKPEALKSGHSSRVTPSEHRTQSAPLAAVPSTKNQIRPSLIATPLEARPLQVQWYAGNGAFAPLAPAMPKLDRAPEVPMLAPDAQPEIVALQLPSTTLFGGETVHGSVIASSNVASVQIKIASFSQVMNKVAPGRFEMSVLVPHTPFFLHRTYTLQVIARNARGDAVTESLPVSVR